MYDSLSTADPRFHLFTRSRSLGAHFGRCQIDLAPHVGASLEVMKRDADKMRDGGPTLFTSVRNNEGVDGVVELIKGAWTAATGGKKA